MDGIVGKYLATQIHELGNSLYLDTGKYIGRSDLPGGDPDSGHAFEDCVYGKLNTMGFK